jgi:hypothetical protein
MDTLEQERQDDETPTARIEPTSSATLVALARIDRLCELALERLQVAPDADAVSAAMADIAQVRALASEVRR